MTVSSIKRIKPELLDEVNVPNSKARQRQRKANDDRIAHLEVSFFFHLLNDPFAQVFEAG